MMIVLVDCWQFIYNYQVRIVIKDEKKNISVTIKSENWGKRKGNSNNQIDNFNVNIQSKLNIKTDKFSIDW